ncbi:MAG TPA: peptide chain release factor N(5)-glutamine methyltransferase [Cyclobacteriaceae bacterium]|jgi:release factor glutamine methyltransferase
MIAFMPSIKEIRNNIFDELSPKLGVEESTALIFILLEFVLKKEKVFLLANPEVEIAPDELIFLENAVVRLINHEPIQYILEEAVFLGRRFYVNPSVLIPRPETEELVLLALKNCKGGERILDIGSGSGVIGISLALEIEASQVYCLDNDAASLQVAKRNSMNHKVQIQLIHSDFLNEIPEINHFDIIVSNPPYIAESEKSLMQKNVLNYEPRKALFVPDNNPLVFYSRIAALRKKLLSPKGKIFVEINEAFGLQIEEIFYEAGSLHVQIFKDINGKDRLVYARF